MGWGEEILFTLILHLPSNVLILFLELTTSIYYVVVVILDTIGSVGLALYNRCVLLNSPVIPFQNRLSAAPQWERAPLVFILRLAALTGAL